MIGAGKAVDLTGRSVMIVEDVFYLATEAEDAVSRAGGQVIGPCADAASGLAALDAAAPDLAIVDINLGAGPSFQLADALQAAGVPFMFLTGYDASTIPERFADVETLQKPVNMAVLVRTIGDALAG